MEKKWREKEIPSLFVSINFPFCSASHVSRTRLSTRSTKKLVLRKNLSQDFCELIFRFDIETALKNNARIDRIDRTDRKIRNNFRGREIRMAKQQAPPNQTVIPFYLINPASRKSSPPHFSSRSAKSKPLCAIKRERERKRVGRGYPAAQSTKRRKEKKRPRNQDRSLLEKIHDPPPSPFPPPFHRIDRKIATDNRAT